MARYIDADRLHEEIMLSKKENPHSENVVRRNHDHEHDHFIAMICNQPAADVKEVVRDGWIKFELEYDEEEKEEIFSCALPDNEQEILVTDGKNVWTDIFLRDAGGECYLDSGFELIVVVTYWMPKPLPPSCGADMRGKQY